MTDMVGSNGHQAAGNPGGRREIRPASPPPQPQPQAAAAAVAVADAKRPTDELEILIRARYPVIYVVTWEEERLEQRLSEIARKRNKTFHVWTCSQGVV